MNRRCLFVAFALLLWFSSCRFAHAQEFALQPGNAEALRPLGTRGSTRITEAELRRTEGLTIRIRREWIWRDGKWDFSFVDENVALCRKLGKPYTLLVMGGGPNPLDPYNLGWYASAARELGKRYADDPLCYAAHVTGCSPAGHSEEQFWKRPMPPRAIAANKMLIDEWAAAFPRQWILFAGAASDPAAMRELVRYGVAAAPGRFVYKINSLSAKLDLDWQGKRWQGVKLMVDAAKLGARIGFEALDNSAASRFGGSWPQALAKKAEIEKRAGSKAVYLAKYRGDL